MSPDQRRALDELAGTYLDGPILGPFVVGKESPPAGQRGVYVVIDPVGACAYVGKAFALRDSQRVRNRIVTHVSDLSKRDAFADFYLIPLRDQTPDRKIAAVEGFVARHLRPYMGSAHPDPLRRDK